MKFLTVVLSCLNVGLALAGTASGVLLDYSVCDVLTRVCPQAGLPAGDSSAKASAWRNERVHFQVAYRQVPGVRLQTGDLVSSSGAKIPARAVTGRFVTPVNVDFGSGVERVPDILDAVPSRAVAAGESASAWFTVDVPGETEPGFYSGTFALAAEDGRRAEVPVSLQVLDRTLPPPPERKFFLDLWVHPWSVAAHFGLKLFSPEHYARLEPLYCEMAAAGQKVILTSIVDLPWGEDYGSRNADIRSMVEYVHEADGSYRADFRLFDEYVAFAKRCGFGPQIHCYTIVKFNRKHIFYYTDGVTGERKAHELYEDTPEYEAFLTPLLQQLEKHLDEKGWLDDACIAIDEVSPERLVKPRAFLRRVAPRLKFALASNVDPMRYRELEKDTDVFSQLLWDGHGITSIGRWDYDEMREARRKAGKITTFYVCTEPQKPNTWFSCPLAETAWIGLYAAAQEYDGFLRWATFFRAERQFDFSASADGYPPGEDVLLYPDGRPSIRWEVLRDSIEDWEKIRILRTDKSLSSALKSALGAYDWAAMSRADETSYREAVKAVTRELNPLPGQVAVPDQVAAWEGGRRAKALHFFRDRLFGYAPVGRPADERFLEDAVETAGGKVRINIYCRRPENASPEHPAPVFIDCDHFLGSERPDGRWNRIDTPTNSIVSRGYAYVRINFNDVALNCYDDRWSNGVHSVYGPMSSNSWGTISAWAWSISRVVDWIETRPELDARRIAVVGHSRGGKTALWAAAQDRRIAMAVPNGSGTGGARLLCADLPRAEPLDWLLNFTVRFWFCPNAQAFKGGAERHLPYDADDLIRLVAPRLVYVGSGSEDSWAGPEGEFEAARRASDLWRAYGRKGLGIETFPKPGEWDHSGDVGYHLHVGRHGLRPWDWERFLDFADLHLKNKDTRK